MSVRTTSLKEWEKPENLEKVTEWAKLGLTNIQIAHNIGIVEQTLYRWRKESPEFDEALMKGKSVIDQIVVNTMLEKIKGYEYEEVIKELDEAGNLITTKVVTKKVPPDTTAMIFWMKNRLAKDFRDTQLTQAQARKIEIETQILEETLASLKGDNKDTSMLDSLVNLFSKDK